MNGYGIRDRGADGEEGGNGDGDADGEKVE